MTILDEIYKFKLTEVTENKKKNPLDPLKARLQQDKTGSSFSRALKTDDPMNIIAEVKRASPSAGTICEHFHPVKIAQAYESGGAAAISVLTDEKFFKGNLTYLTEVKNAIRLPVLRKDFIIDPYQIYEAGVAGADAILLIAALLSMEEIQRFLEVSKEMNLECLVEVHTEAELEKVLQTSAQIIGINNRDLATFKTDLSLSLHLGTMIPPEKIRVSESGIKTRADIEKLIEKGFHAVLIGETLMRSTSIPLKIKELLGFN